MADEKKKWEIQVTDEFIDFYNTLPEKDKRAIDEAIDETIKQMSENGHVKNKIPFDQLSPEVTPQLVQNSSTHGRGFVPQLMVKKIYHLHSIQRLDVRSFLEYIGHSITLLVGWMMEDRKMSLPLTLKICTVKFI